MKVPERLYKYRSGSIQDIVSLSGGKLWMPSPANFNDPFDCAYDVVLPPFSEDDCIAMLDSVTGGKGRELAPTIPGLQDQVAAGMRALIEHGRSMIKGVCCFSEVVDDLLMWGHYCNCHKGFCLEFDTDKEPLFKKAKPVVYSDSLPVLSSMVAKDPDFDGVSQLVLTKATFWKYEREWRVLHNQENLLYGYRRESLVGIYFGAKMPADQRLMIAKLVDNTDTKLYEMQLSKTHFSLTASPLSFTPLDYRSVAPNAARG